MEAQAPPKIPSLPYYQLLLSLRYVRSRYSAIAAVLSVAFGVAVIVIVLSIMGGYMEELRESIRGQESHLMILGPRPFAVTRIARLEALVDSVTGVAGTAPFIETLAMYRSGQFNPCHLRGIAPTRQAKVSSLGKYVLRPAELEAILARLQPKGGAAPPEPAGVASSERPTATRAIDEVLRAPDRAPLGADELEAFFRRDSRTATLQSHNPAILPDLQGDVPPACLVGIHLLLDRQMFLGQIVTLITLDANTSEPTYKKFVITGAFKTGDYDADSQAVYAHVDTLKNMLGLFDLESNSFRYEGLRVAVQDLSKLQQTKRAIEAALAASDEPGHSRLRVYTWEQLRKTLLSAVEIEKFVIYFLMLLLVGFTACMVLLMLLLTVIEKTRDIGVLSALGATPSGIVRVFLANGLILSFAGTLLGLAGGYLFCLYINPIHDWIYIQTGLRLFPAEIYHMDRIPIAFHPMDVLLSVAPPVLLGFLASLAPAIWASRRDPIKAIHYE